MASRFRKLISKPRRAAAYVVGIGVSYLLYIIGLTTNPPGFYIDESANSYNAYTFYQRWQGEFGDTLPLFFPVFPLAPPLDYINFLDPVYEYCLAALFYIFPPSFFLPRALSATAVFVACIVIGVLARKISGRTWIGIVVGAMALMTPWLYELGRTAFGVSFYPLSVALLLFALYQACSRTRWQIADILFIAFSLALCTYSYAIGRLLGPLFAIGMVLLITNRQRLRGVLLSWVGYAVSLVPMLIFHLRHPHALTGRYNMTVGYIRPEMPFGEMVSGFLTHYIENISIYRLLFMGDQNLRHHISDTGPILLGTFALVLVAVFIIFVRLYRETWWLYVIYGFIVSAIPASLTRDPFHSLRLAAMPVFLLVLAIPAIMWLAGLVSRAKGTEFDERAPVRPKWRLAILLVVLTAVFAQGVYFQVRYWVYTPDRAGYFDDKFPKAFEAALAQPQRPIYLVDQYYYHTYWYSIIRGIDLSNYVYLWPYNRPPINSVVFSGEEKCTACDVIYKDIPYIVYTTKTGPPAPENGAVPPASTQMEHPRGIAVDPDGSYFVTDTGNARVVQFDKDGQYVSAFGTKGAGEGELKTPNGIVIAPDGYLYVTDADNNKFVKFDTQGNFVKQWLGPDGGFYGPRDLALGQHNDLYIVDQGKTRIVRFDLQNETFSSFAGRGSDDGQLSEPTGIGIGENLVYVADTGNERIQVFDLDGKYVRGWKVPAWASYSFRYPDVAYDDRAKLLYISSSGTGEVLVYGLDGKLVDTVKPPEGQELSNPSALTIATIDGKRKLYIVSTASSKISYMDLNNKGIVK